MKKLFDMYLEASKEPSFHAGTHRRVTIEWLVQYNPAAFLAPPKSPEEAIEALLASKDEIINRLREQLTELQDKIAESPMKVQVELGLSFRHSKAPPIPEIAQWGRVSTVDPEKAMKDLSEITPPAPIDVNQLSAPGMVRGHSFRMSSDIPWLERMALAEQGVSSVNIVKHPEAVSENKAPAKKYDSICGEKATVTKRCALPWGHSGAHDEDP